MVVLVVRPSGKNAKSLVAAIATTGKGARRMAERLPIFTSGVAYPDWCVINARSIASGEDGIVAAGYFDNRWNYNPKDSVWSGK